MNDSPSPHAYDALLLLTYGGPECAAEVGPFLDHILAGKRTPDARRADVERHYAHFGGVSPMNAHARELMAAMQKMLAENGTALPVYWACRHSQPLVADVFRRMARDGVRRTLVFVPAPFGGVFSDGAYRDALAEAAESVGPHAPQWVKMPPFYEHPDFLTAQADVLAQALREMPEWEREHAALLFTAHSVPVALADTAEYARQVETCVARMCEMLAGMIPHAPRHAYVAWQSASGRPGTWLEPGVKETLENVAQRHPGATAMVVPLGFPLENMEIVYDLDMDAAAHAKTLGLTFCRLPTVGTHPLFVKLAITASQA